MNILFWCDEYPPLCTGGIGTATKTVAEALARKGHGVYVVSGWLPTHDLPFETENNGVTIYRLRFYEKISFLYKDNMFSNIQRGLLSRSGIQCTLALNERTRLYEFINKIIEEKHIDLIELPDYNFLSKYYNHSTLVDNPQWIVPVIGRVHGNDSFQDYYMNGSMTDIVRTNDKMFFESCDRILAVSRFAAEFVNDKLGVQKKVDVIYNPMSEDFMVEVDDINIERSKDIVFIGKLFETKGTYNLIRAFNSFTQKYPEYRLVMIGSGGVDKAMSFANPEAKARIHFTGFVTGAEIRTYLDKAAFAVVPSFFETLGQAAIEIMGRGNILIYTSAATGPEIIDDGVDGYLVDPHDVEAISTKMSYVADHIDELTAMRVKAAQKVRNRFSESSIINQLEGYYQSVIKNKK